MTPFPSSEAPVLLSLSRRRANVSYDLINRFPHTGRRSAFTLIELLVVIAIIAILAAILFPVFAQAREKARQAACLSNFKQVSTSIMMYIQDYDEQYPLSMVRHPSGVWLAYADIPADWDSATGSNWALMSESMWVNSIQPYAKNYQIFKCPNASQEDRPAGWNFAAPKKPWASVSYSYNPLLSQLSQAGINQPASTIMMLEPYGKRYWSGITAGNPIMLCPNGNQPCVYSSCATTAGNGTTSGFTVWNGINPTRWIHNQGMNFSFSDGHVKWRRLGGVLKPGNTDRNVDPFTNYNADGTSDSYWPTGCGATSHAQLFRPDL
jgi:prepilin-type N-terminal cleavage/methylation domain-containing protein/prepilin-type processing-associated H-X9-DG protein